MRDTYLRIISEDLEDILGNIQIPTIIIWGEKDNITTLNQGRLINKKIDDSRLEIIPNVGHSPHKEVPEILSQKILENINH